LAVDAESPTSGPDVRDNYDVGLAAPDVAPMGIEARQADASQALDVLPSRPDVRPNLPEVPPLPAPCPTKQIEPTTVKTCGVAANGTGKQLLWPTSYQVGYTAGYVCHYDCSKAYSGDMSMPAPGDWACVSQINLGTSLETIVCLGQVAGCDQCVP
jgi:hypothetical protein